MNNKSERLTTTQSKVSVPLSKRATSSSRADWWIPAALIALTAIPVLAGVVRLVTMAANVPVTHENARFFAAPLPVIIHIISATLFCILAPSSSPPHFAAGGSAGTGSLGGSWSSPALRLVFQVCG